MFFVPLITSALWSAASRPYSFSENTLTAVDNICTVVRGFATVFIFLKILSQNRLLRSVVSRPSSCCASGISVRYTDTFALPRALTIIVILIRVLISVVACLRGKGFFFSAAQK